METIMADILVMDWMEEFESLTESEKMTYASEQEHNHEVMLALYVVLDDPNKCKKSSLVEGVCRQLLEFYRSDKQQLRKFALQYIPTLVYLHLSNPKMYPTIQTLLVSFYNLEVVDNKGQPRVISFRVPSIAQSSVYHDSTSLEPAFIAENSLRRWEECNTKLVSWGPLPQVDTLNAQNRQRVVTALVFLYNRQLAGVMLQGLEHTCRAISRLVSQGFSTSGSARSSTDSDSISNISMTPRLVVSNTLLLELLHVVYHALERGASGAAQALHDINNRATYEAYADVLLATNAVNNLLRHSPSASITTRPSATRTVSKSMITNASFRTKKLPDDIPIQDEPTEALDSITEEQEETEKSKSRGSVSALKHLPKLPGLSKKHKAKNSPIPPWQGDQQQQQQQMEMMMAAGGDQVNSLITESPPADSPHTVHVSAV